MPATSWKKSPAKLVERFAIALPEHPAVVRKPMFGYPWSKRPVAANYKDFPGTARLMHTGATAEL